MTTETITETKTETKTETPIINRMPPGEIARIRGMLKHRRQARSGTEHAFIARYLDKIPGIYADTFGNRILISPGSRVMISCHTDSVHRMQGKQAIQVSDDGIVSLSPHEKLSNCLGADDAAGMYAAIRMIEAGVKATFVFHRDEESGGNGSSWLARYYPEWLESFDICLALDRRGTDDVIVSQQCDMCASEAFAEALGEALAMNHHANDGIFTDSANYTGLIAECSNLSIGYQREHTTAETLDLHYLETVIQRLIAVDWSALPVVRRPGETWPELDNLDADELGALDDEMTLLDNERGWWTRDYWTQKDAWLKGGIQ